MQCDQYVYTWYNFENGVPPLAHSYGRSSPTFLGMEVNLKILKCSSLVLSINKSFHLLAQKRPQIFSKDVKTNMKPPLGDLMQVVINNFLFAYCCYFHLWVMQVSKDLKDLKIFTLILTLASRCRDHETVKSHV